MSGPRHRLVLERVVGEVTLDSRSALVVEQLESKKIVVWKAPRTPAGRSILAGATRVYSIPPEALGVFIALLQRLDDAAEHATERRRRA